MKARTISVNEDLVIVLRTDTETSGTELKITVTMLMPTENDIHSPALRLPSVAQQKEILEHD